MTTAPRSSRHAADVNAARIRSLARTVPQPSLGLRFSDCAVNCRATRNEMPQPCDYHANDGHPSLRCELI